MMEKNTKQLIHRLKTISNDRLVQHVLSSMACGVITEAADRIEELEKSESFLKERVDLAIKDRDCYESLSKSRLEGLLGATEANRVSLDRIADLERKVTGLEKVAENRLDLLDRQSKQIADPQAYRQPLSENEIENMWLMSAIYGTNLEKAVALTRAIEKAHGIGDDV